jgi:hypothetical protein
MFVAFELLLQTPGGDERPTLQTIERFRPDEEAMRLCLQWLGQHGVTAHTTGFSIACTAPPSLFESLFDAKVEAAGDLHGRTVWRTQRKPRVPSELSAWVASVEVPPPPALM